MPPKTAATGNDASSDYIDTYKLLAQQHKLLFANRFEPDVPVAGVQPSIDLLENLTALSQAMSREGGWREVSLVLSQRKIQRQLIPAFDDFYTYAHTVADKQLLCGWYDPNNPNEKYISLLSKIVSQLKLLIEEPNTNKLEELALARFELDAAMGLRNKRMFAYLSILIGVILIFFASFIASWTVFISIAPATVGAFFAGRGWDTLVNERRTAAGEMLNRVDHIITSIHPSVSNSRSTLITKGIRRLTIMVSGEAQAGNCPTRRI